MKKIYLIERYIIIRKTGTWTLKNSYRTDVREKNRIIKYAKNEGYKYDRKEKSYILSCDPVESSYDYAIIVTSY